MQYFTPQRNFTAAKDGNTGKRLQITVRKKDGGGDVAPPVCNGLYESLQAAIEAGRATLVKLNTEKYSLTTHADPIWHIGRQIIIIDENEAFNAVVSGLNFSIQGGVNMLRIDLNVIKKTA